MANGTRLSALGIAMMFVAFVAGALVIGIWFWSSNAWREHLTNSYVTGISVHEAIRTDAPLPPGISAQVLGDEHAAWAASGTFSLIPDTPKPAFVTNLSILSQTSDPLTSRTLHIGIVSDSLRYAVSELTTTPGQSSAEKFGTVTRLLATYCSEVTLFTSFGDDQWWQIKGDAIWGCDVAPPDLRLLAVLLGGVLLAVMGTLVADTSAQFERFAYALRTRRRLGGPESYSAAGPKELQEIVSAVNAYLEAERDQLSQRAMLLSGVSHDLGTPATRLRLRTALIEDQELRDKLNADIDSMIGMIESVLTYTRAELSAEEPRMMALTSLIEAIVDDYQDMGKPVELRPVSNPSVKSGHTVFSSHPGQHLIPEQQRLVATVRPISLQRAVSNLIDNALKYGRRATVELSATASYALISVEDEGSGMTVEDMEAVIAPFKRGHNTISTEGSGLGLTIVSAVATQHGGQLYFESGPKGLRACIRIARA